ncbi:amidohydrolase [Blastococcus sp. CCUG 61487]|uniref:amidohydrolase n=1 Tax=Blastococcus sp. CCUG 61487 TaxID=1840703 RepID=UPI001137F3CA|nr:amidohydrolase [Blastococcus sp. CCUG 61487]TKJ22382.1 amidohydrolase [Blastococcus sp. CCUG 61487]
MSPADVLADLENIYRDLHAHPELAFAEHRTAGIVADRLRALGYETTTGVGGTGVVGVLRNGPGPTALLRADMDALPVHEETGLPYASTATGTAADGSETPVMHACGHDVHVTCLLGAAATLAAERGTWSGTLQVLFQPAEEVGGGAQSMIDDRVFDRVGRPDVVLGQHVAPLPAGLLGLRRGPAFAGADMLHIVLHGRGGHGSRPETTVDPVVMAAATVMRLQTVVSREVAGGESAVVTVGALHAGTAGNVIPERAEMRVSLRSYDTEVRERLMTSIDRIVRAEAAASGAPQEPEVHLKESFPVLVNDPDAGARTIAGWDRDLGPGLTVDPGPVTGSEDVGILATAAGVPLVYWLLGGADPAAFAGVTDRDGLQRVVRGLPSNHSPQFAPVIEPTLSTGVKALVSAARTWLPVEGRA